MGIFDGNSTHRFERKLASALRGMVLPLADFLAPLSERLYRTDRQVEDYNHVRLHRALAWVALADKLAGREKGDLGDEGQWIPRF